MPAFSGTAGSVTTFTGGTILALGIAEWTLDGSMSPVESTSFGNQWDEYVPSVRNATGSFSGNREQTDSGQSALVTSYLGGSVLALRLYENATKYWLISTAYITGMSPTVSVKGKGDMSFTFQVSGPVTYV